MPITIQINSHIPEVEEIKNLAIKRGLLACGEIAEKYAKENEIRVDTGRLRNSITHAESDEANEHVMAVGTNVEYAQWIENGGKGKSPLHFLKRSISEHVDEYKETLKQNLENA